MFSFTRDLLDVDASTPSFASEQLDSSIKLLSHWKKRCFMRGRRGCYDTSAHKKSVLLRQRRKLRRDRGRQVQEEVVLDYCYTWGWEAEMAEFEGILKFPMTPGGDLGRYYQRLLETASSGLRAEWAEWDRVPYDPDYHALELLEEEHDQYWLYELDLASEAHEQQVESERQRLLWGVPEECWDHTYHPEDDYLLDDPWDGYDTPQELSGDPFEVEEMIARQEAEEDELLETLTIAHSGGPKGWRAHHVVQI